MLFSLEYFSTVHISEALIQSDSQLFSAVHLCCEQMEASDTRKAVFDHSGARQYSEGCEWRWGPMWWRLELSLSVRFAVCCLG